MSTDDLTPSDRRADTERLIAVINRSARLVFAGMIVVSCALVVLAFGAASPGAEPSDAFVNRELHYAVMLAVVAVYVYVQRMRP